jgi:hypothetical protein
MMSNGKMAIVNKASQIKGRTAHENIKDKSNQGSEEMMERKCRINVGSL